MKVKWLEDFVALSNAPNMYRAAQARHVTHPAFGRRIKALEEWVGVPLFDRSQQRITLNGSGRIFLASAMEVLDILEDTRKTLQSPDKRLPRKVFIASGRTLSHSILPVLLDRAQKGLPQFQVKVTTTSLNYGIDMLMEGSVDILLCHAHEALHEKMDTDDYVFHRVGVDKLIAVSAPLVDGHPKYRLPKTESDSNVPVLTFAPAMSLGKILKSRLNALCRAEALESVYESDLADAIYAMAKKGYGLAWLPLSLVENDLKEGSLIRVDTPANDIDMEVRIYKSVENPKRLVTSIWDVLAGM